MPTFVLLANFTDQGVRNIKDTVSRAEAFKEMAKRSGITMKELCWTLGRHDVVAVFEAADDESAAALALSAYFVFSALTPLFGAFPVPLVGIGVSPVIGFWMGAGLLAAIASREDATPD